MVSLRALYHISPAVTGMPPPRPRLQQSSFKIHEHYITYSVMLQLQWHSHLDLLDAAGCVPMFANGNTNGASGWFPIAMVVFESSGPGF